jgi:hypothetical protein
MEPTEPLDSGTPQPDAERGHAPSIHTVTPVRSASRAGRDALMALAGGGVVLAVVFGLRDRLFTPPRRANRDSGGGW